jgi:hypothetical protein
MNDDPVRPLHFHETAPTERRRVNSVGYLLLLGAVAALVIAAVLGLG